ncbi:MULTISPECIES: type II secretion system protein N [unclassified Serratia (in: enterobacteria)]|uniref:type II secretion system protein N n=1 Tax=unclassified Serratia (in: enterobacteria) TaxID=2647522 RepID=UPI002ED22CDE|nr:type II secretion system protein N [Serratia sp. C2(2)]MEE4447872.1 type II secretion system protein N [Serratia sp. C2(1)]
MSKRFIVFFISFFFLANVVFIFSQLWKIYRIDQAGVLSRSNIVPAERHYVGFPAQDDIEKINNAEFFGRYGERQGDRNNGMSYKISSQGLNDDVINNAPETRLAGRITGLLLSDDHKHSLVIIERAGKQASYGMGDRIAGSNLVILRILQDKILLDENGYYASMIFKD